MRWIEYLRTHWRMTGIAAVIALCTLALDIYFDMAKRDARPGPLQVTARPVPMDGNNPARERLGPLRYLGGWHLTSDTPGFGGISALSVVGEGFLALTDSGHLLGFSLPPARMRHFIAPLPVRPVDAKIDITWDSEAMTHDPVSGDTWVGFELIHSICRYSPDFARVKHCKRWPQLRIWPATESIESLARMPDGRFLALAEGLPGKREGYVMALFARDPADGTSPPPVMMDYVPPTGFRPTDAVAIGHGQMLVLNRRVTIGSGFTAVLSVIDLADLAPGAVVRAREIARFEPPVQADNFEALAIETRAGGRILWMASDNNFQFFQRTLLLSFALPQGRI